MFFVQFYWVLNIAECHLNLTEIEIRNLKKEDILFNIFIHSKKKQFNFEFILIFVKLHSNLQTELSFSWLE